MGTQKIENVDTSAPNNNGGGHASKQASKLAPALVAAPFYLHVRRPHPGVFRRVDGWGNQKMFPIFFGATNGKFLFVVFSLKGCHHVSFLCSYFLDGFQALIKVLKIVRYITAPGDHFGSFLNCFWTQVNNVSKSIFYIKNMKDDHLIWAVVAASRPWNYHWNST